MNSMEEFEAQPFTSDSVVNTLERHVTKRKYLDKPIPRETLLRLLNAARRSPTSSNMQAYSLVVVEEQQKKDVLAELSRNSHISTCAAFVAICADVHRLRQGVELHDQHLAQNLENTLVATIDASLVGMSLSMAAESIGLGTCMIGGMRNKPREVAEALNLPQGVFVVYGLTLGWPAPSTNERQKPRLPEDLMIHWEAYNNDDISSALQQYDQELAEHYASLGRGGIEAAWTGVMAKKFSQPRRAFLRTTLEDMGFSFE